jgi:hypoxanthine-guanine phosphoribosyltransferase
MYGVEVKKEWVYGYGMDNEAGYCRNLDAIYKI